MPGISLGAHLWEARELTTKPDGQLIEMLKIQDTITYQRYQLFAQMGVFPGVTLGRNWSTWTKAFLSWSGDHKLKHFAHTGVRTTPHTQEARVLSTEPAAQHVNLNDYKVKSKFDCETDLANLISFTVLDK